MPPRNQIFLVEDNAFFCVMMAEHMKKEGFDILYVHSRKEALLKLPEITPSLIILDVMLPDGNGLDIIPAIRKRTNVPIIVLSGRSSMSDRIEGLDKGADDYIAKPFEMAEVVARVKAQLRHHKALTAPSEKSLVIGPWSLDASLLQAVDGNGASAGLTYKEYRLLETLLRHPNTALSRNDLLETARDGHFSTTLRAIDVQILRIRKKLALSDSAPQRIEAVRGFGYIFIDRGQA